MQVEMRSPTGGTALVHPSQVENMERRGWTKVEPPPQPVSPKRKARRRKATADRPATTEEDST